MMASRLLRLSWILAALAAPISMGAGNEGDTHPFTVHDLQDMDRISDPRVSPDGKLVVFVRSVTDLEENRLRPDLWLVGMDGGKLRRLTNHPAGSEDPRWAPDSRSIYFLSERGGHRQVWRIRPDGGEAEQVTREPLDIGTFLLSPDGEHLAVSMEVFPDLGGPDETKARLDELSKRKATGRIYEKLFIRHWDKWKDGRRSHVFVMPIEQGEPGKSMAAASSQSSRPAVEAPSRRSPVAVETSSRRFPLAVEASSRRFPLVDVMKGMDADVPSKPFGEAAQITFTPDGRSLVFAARDAGREEPWSTDFDLYLAPIDGSAAPRCLTESNSAWDDHPVFSPDGRTLAYLAMSRPGYEADRFRIMLRPWPDGTPRVVVENWDHSAGLVRWSPDGRTLYTTADHLGQRPLFAIDLATGYVRALVREGSVRSVEVMADRIVYALDQLRSPAELFAVELGSGEIRQLTHINAERMGAARIGETEQFSFAGWNDEEVHAYVVKPVDFDPAKKYPVAFLIHGGPQGSFGNDFHYRWNPQVYAGAGYAAIMVDFHGSTGYGQAFTDSIRGDWGGKPLIDLRKGLAAALDRYPWMDGERVAALGASFGGYMINWIAGQWPDRFRCLVNHDGNLDERMAYFDTEELWFPEWDHKGVPWTNPAGYEDHNPVNFIQNWKTPMLVIHGGLDFRVVDTQGISTFTALQRRGIPSKFLYFPDENHWVRKPANSILWHETVLDWINQWTGEARDGAAGE